MGKNELGKKVGVFEKVVDFPEACAFSLTPFFTFTCALTFLF